jgi:uncharacterized protein YutE (UPF0331/DUF86 family)
MTDRDLVAKKLAAIETYLRELRALGRPEALRTDVREERFLTRTLQMAIEAALDVASHVVSDERLGEPATNRELFEILERNGWLPRPLAERLGDMAGFRNVLVHGYDDLDLDVVEDVLRHHLDDLLAFVEAMRARS